ncbi:hypothetical protein ACS0TY_007215 [Phlomoides rotata]
MRSVRVTEASHDMERDQDTEVFRMKGKLVMDNKLSVIQFRPAVRQLKEESSRTLAVT